MRNSVPILFSVRNTRLHLPTRMHGGDSTRQVTILHLGETRFAYQSRESPLGGKSPYALGQIAVGGAVAGDDLAEPGQYRKGIEIVKPVETGRGHAREFEAEETSARPQHAKGLVKHVV